MFGRCACALRFIVIQRNVKHRRNVMDFHCPHSRYVLASHIVYHHCVAFNSQPSTVLEWYSAPAQSSAHIELVWTLKVATRWAWLIETKVLTLLLYYKTATKTVQNLETRQYCPVIVLDTGHLASRTRSVFYCTLAGVACFGVDENSIDRHDPVCALKGYHVILDSQMQACSKCSKCILMYSRWYSTPICHSIGHTLAHVKQFVAVDIEISSHGRDCVYISGFYILLPCNS